MKYLRPFEHKDRGFESHSRHGFLCLCFPVQVVALWQADPLFKESCQLSVRCTASELIEIEERKQSLIRQGRRIYFTFQLLLSLLAFIIVNVESFRNKSCTIHRHNLHVLNYNLTSYQKSVNYSWIKLFALPLSGIKCSVVIQKHLSQHWKIFSSLTAVL
jgi:hypothetical protein